MVKLALASWLRKGGDRLRNWEYLARWHTIFQNIEDGEYINAVFDGPVARHLDAWIATASVEDVLTWKPPSLDGEPVFAKPDDEEVEVWAWVVDRFTQTYLDRWSLSSLKREYKFVQGSWQPGFPTEILAERVVGREGIAAALADRAVVSTDELDPSIYYSFVEQALTLLRDGQRAAAAALFDAVRKLKPKDLVIQNNYAFCILIDKPDEARSLLEEVLERGSTGNPAMSWYNLAVAELLLGRPSAALEACERAYESSTRKEAYLWVRKNEEWIVERVIPQAGAAHLGTELERSMGLSGDKWEERLRGQAASSGPSLAETGEGDL